MDECTAITRRSRTIKKKTRNRLILLQNLNKGKARKQARCGFQSIPYPLKFSAQIHYLYANVTFMENNDTIVAGASLYNNFKAYRSTQVVNHPNQKILRIKVENKNTNIQPMDWRAVVERLENSESAQVKQWADSVRAFGQRYEMVIQDFQRDQQEMSHERYKMLMDTNSKTERTRENILKSYPCIEFKSQFKDGQIQLTEINAGEKYLTELGHTMESFTSTVLQEGIPIMNSMNTQGASLLARLRLQKHLTTDPDGYQTPEFESSVVMKNGCLKKVKLRVHYHTCYEKGVLGFAFIVAIVAKQRPFLPSVTPLGDAKLDREFVEMMTKKERDMNDFLSMYYNETVEEKFTNIHRVCGIKEISVQAEEELH